MLAGNKPKFVSIKTLVEFAAKSGSIDRKFTPAPTGAEGIEGHKRVTANRPDDYKIELSLSIQHGDITFRGRADGYSPTYHCIEEIKTFYGDVQKIPENHRRLHWAQAKCYGWMLCAKEQLSSVNIALIYFDLHHQKEHRVEETWSAQNLRSDFEQLATEYSVWQEKINLRLQQLEFWINDLQFPYTSMHSSQRLMAEAVYKSASTGRVVLAEAPTGTGKTLAGLFPAIKAMTRTEVDKIFYLTAKSTGKQLALDNIALITTDSQNSPLRTLELTAHEKSCLQPDKQCTGDSCIYAFEFYKKLKQAREAAFEHTLLDKTTLTQIALELEICPFYLSMEMTRWVDIIVADVNYYFDGTPLLLGLTQEFNWHPYLLVDESHNLIDRGRQMYSAKLNRSQLLNAKKSAPSSIKKPLEAINKQWLNLIKESKDQDFRLIAAIPEKFNLSLLEFTNTYIELLQQQPEHQIQHTVAHEFFFESLQFQKVFEALGDDFCIDMRVPAKKAEVLTLRNLVPARLLAQRTEYAQGACFFSATLNPASYYQSLLGLPEDSVHIKVPSPFHQDQLTVRLASNLSTRFKDRGTALEPICELICKQIISAPGNAIAFFPSYEFLHAVKESLQKKLRNQNTQLLVQSRRMTELERQSFIESFNQNDNILGLAVLGGTFSEGIDLAGDALKGVFIATLGLPQVNPVSEHLRRVMDSQFERGYDFTYTYPGIQKVIQAAGRVIRTQNDTGYLWLLDERFKHNDIKKLLPDWWDIKSETIPLTSEKPRMS